MGCNSWHMCKYFHIPLPERNTNVIVCTCLQLICAVSTPASMPTWSRGLLCRIVREPMGRGAGCWGCWGRGQGAIDPDGGKRGEERVRGHGSVYARAKRGAPEVSTERSDRHDTCGWYTLTQSTHTGGEVCVSLGVVWRNTATKHCG